MKPNRFRPQFCTSSMKELSHKRKRLFERYLQHVSKPLDNGKLCRLIQKWEDAIIFMFHMKAVLKFSLNQTHSLEETFKTVGA